MAPRPTTMTSNAPSTIRLHSQQSQIAGREISGYSLFRIETRFSPLSYRIVGKPGVAAVDPIQLLKLLRPKAGRRPPRHIYNPSDLMFFTRRSGQRIGNVFIFYRKVRPRSQLHRPNTEASQIAEVHLCDRILQDERRVRDGEHIVGADSTLHLRAFLPPIGICFAESLQDTSGPRQHK
jgi:hypothetical protein